MLLSAKQKYQMRGNEGIKRQLQVHFTEFEACGTQRCRTNCKNYTRYTDTHICYARHRQ